ncbi:MAG: hypothetical protein LBH88_00395 [Candidatus Methanoplasma sp.]|jgi:hypothetical protein|nr:hypothetical protein [Candidatus Methanoplasma sp.]
MPYKVPDEDIVSNAIRTVMGRNPHIETQTEFLRLVRKELSKQDSEYRVSGERIRRIGVDKGLVKISIDYRESDIKDLPHICPVCRNALSSVKNRSLDGRTVEINRKCTVCPYTIGKEVLAPGRYAFSRSSGVLLPHEISFRKLKKAGAKIKEAMDLIGEAVGGTEFEDRGNDLISDLRAMVDSKESAASVRSISLDVKESGNNPAWASPLVSVKNSDRKDI